MKSPNRDGQLKVRFWGVRGSIPTPEESHLRTGGNTPCVVLQYGDEPPVIIDAGTGIRAFGTKLIREGNKPFHGTLLLSHFHWDHIQGFPFFAPIYSSHSHLKIFSGRPSSELKRNLDQQMREPYFPMGFREIPAQYSCGQLTQEGLDLGSLSVTPVCLNHPGQATGFRIDSPNGSIAYVSDHEHGNEVIDRQIVKKCAGVDMMIYDSHFTPEEYGRFVGWGHSTWLQGTILAKEAGVKQFRLFHHNPARTDEQLQILVETAREHIELSSAATETEMEWIAGHAAETQKVP